MEKNPKLLLFSAKYGSIITVRKSDKNNEMLFEERKSL